VSKFGRSQASWNGEKINENARVSTEAILRKELRQDCKTFTRRFDSDRRLHNLNPINSLCERDQGIRLLFVSLLITFNTEAAPDRDELLTHASKKLANVGAPS
jgi:hypothetical protein